MIFGKILKAYRGSSRQGMREIASEIGVSLATISRIEKGLPVDQNTLLLIINWLFGGQGNKVSPNTTHNTGSTKLPDKLLDFMCYLVDHCEGNIITEEYVLQIGTQFNSQLRAPRLEAGT